MVKDIPSLDDVQRRVVAGLYGDVRVLNLYVPNGESVESDKYLYKLGWLDKLIEFVSAEIKRYPKLVGGVIEQGIQYICALNSDNVPYTDFSESFKSGFEKQVIITFTDATDDGGLLGIRF